MRVINFTADDEPVTFQKRPIFPPDTFAKGTVTVLTETQQWKKLLKCLETDKVLDFVLWDYTEELNLEFAFDSGIIDLFNELSLDESINKISRIITRRVITEDFLCYLREIYKRFFTWVMLCGGAPVGYVKIPAILTGTWDDSQMEIFTYQAAKTHNLKILSEFSKITSETLEDNTVEFFSTIGPDWQGWELNTQLSMLDPGLRGAGSLVALKVIKLLTAGMILHVPEPQSTKIFVQGTKWVAMSAETVFDFRWVLGRPRSHHHLGPIAKGVEDSINYASITEKFKGAIMKNTDRALIVSPIDRSAVTDAPSANLSKYFSTLVDRYPHQIYDDIIKKNTTPDFLTDPSILNMLPSELVGGAGIGNPHSNTYDDFTKRKLLSDLKVRLETDGMAAKAYTALVKFADTVTSGDQSAIAKSFAQLSESDKRRFHQLVTPPQITSDDIQWLGKSGKPVATMMNSIGVPELEEIHQMWTLMWKTHLGGEPLYMRRRNAVQYKGTGNREGFRNLTTIKTHFSACLNTTTFRLCKITDHKEIQISDIFILNKICSDTAGIKTLFAKTLTILPSEITFLNIADGTSISSITGLSNELTSSPKPRFFSGGRSSVIGPPDASSGSSDEI